MVVESNIQITHLYLTTEEQTQLLLHTNLQLTTFKIKASELHVSKHIWSSYKLDVQNTITENSRASLRNSFANLSFESFGTWLKDWQSSQSYFVKTVEEGLSDFCYLWINQLWDMKHQILIQIVLFYWKGMNKKWNSVNNLFKTILLPLLDFGMEFLTQ
jgi:hypothetical protein